MSLRARYPPPGMGGGRGGGGGGGTNPNAGPNPNFQPRNPTQQYVQRNPAPGNRNHQLFQNPQPQQWLRRNQFPSADSTVEEFARLEGALKVTTSGHPLQN